MDWTTTRTDEALIGHPTGRIDEGSWEELNTALDSAIAEAADAGLAFLIDLAGVPYMSSRGLRVLTLARREAMARSVPIALARPNDRMREILAISRYDKIFEIRPAIAS